MGNERFLFISYVRQDAEFANGLGEALRAQGVRTWIDTEDLRPGVAWAEEIRRALARAAGVVFIVTEASLRSRWVTLEVQAALKADAGVYPVVIGDMALMPPWLANYQGILLPAHPAGDDFAQAAAKLAKALRRPPNDPLPHKPSFENLAPKLAEEARKTPDPPIEEAPNSVFLVHGHNDELLLDVETFIESLGVRTVVLKKVGGTNMSLLGKFLSVGGKAHFAVVILSSDDWGASRRQFDAPNVGEKALKFRARQNVILELGFFFGRLGFERVFVLQKELEVYPDFERPSDIDGMVPVLIDNKNEWKIHLKAKLIEAGFQIEARRI